MIETFLLSLNEYVLCMRHSMTYEIMRFWFDLMCTNSPEKCKFYLPRKIFGCLFWFETYFWIYLVWKLWEIVLSLWTVVLSMVLQLWPSYDGSECSGYIRWTYPVRVHTAVPCKIWCKHVSYTSVRYSNVLNYVKLKL